MADLTPKTINDLPGLSAMSDSDLFAVSSGGEASKAAWSLLKSTLLNALFPVGSIVIRGDNTNPGTIYGGTWTQIKDTFILAAGDTYSLNGTGGEATVTLTVNEMPSHAHDLRMLSGELAEGTRFSRTGTTGSNYVSGIVQETGGGQAHNNMPPYIVKYVWERTN